MEKETERVRQLVTELNSIIGRVTNLKTASQDIQGLAERIDGSNQQAIREVVTGLFQVQQTIHTVFSSLNPIREVMLDERVKLEQFLNPKRAGPS